MIAKKNPKTEARSTNSAAALVDYILDAKGRGAKVLYSWASNCSDPSDIALCTQEMTATQALNRRTERSKTYHLIVSLAPGERLNEEQLRRVEEHFCKALGLGEHQRIVAVHSDTQNLHMHLAISKIHPLTLNCIEPYRDYRKLQVACRELEAEFGLQPGIHQDGGKDLEAARGGEVHRHIMSFQTWLKQHIREGLVALMGSGSDWQGLQDYLATFDVEVRERGAGFVFAHRSLKLFVKASAVDRSFSRKHLEDAFGPFDASAPIKSTVTPTMSYRSTPLAVSQESERLFQLYTQEKKELISQRAAAWTSIKEERAEQFAEIRVRYAARRREVKLDRVIRRGRKHLVFKSLGAQMKAEIQACYQAPAHHNKTTVAPGWRDWLQARAQGGDEGALGVLRHRGRSKSGEGEGVAVIAGTDAKHSLFSGLPRRVLRDGAVEYETAKGIFTDYGSSIVVKSAEPEVLKAAMVVAQAKFGEAYRIESGHELFATVSLTPGAKLEPENPAPKRRGPER